MWTLLGLRGLDRVRVLASIGLQAVLPRGEHERQHVRASPSYRVLVLYDHVAYKRCGAAGEGAGRHHGQVSLLLRTIYGDVALVPMLVPADGEEGALTERGFTQLRWDVRREDEGGIAEVRLELGLPRTSWMW